MEVITKAFTVNESVKELSDGTHHTFVTMKMEDWCNIIPVTRDGMIVLVSQWRAGIDSQSFEFPGGKIDHYESASFAALRELEEETGYVPAKDCLKVTDLGWSFANPAIQNNRVSSFIVGPVERISNQKLDTGEEVGLVLLSIPTFEEWVRSGEFNHALMLATLAKLYASGGNLRDYTGQ